MKYADRLPLWQWMILPLGFMLAVIPISTSSYKINELFMDENGVVELLQAALLLVSGVTAFRAWRSIPRERHKWFRAWLLLAAICCFFVFGEEVSWGQWWFKWTTPDYWKVLNQQQETNLHNTSRYLNQVPRRLLEFSVICGGILIHLVALIPTMKRHLPQRFILIYPPATLSITAFCYVLLLILSRLGRQVYDLSLIPHTSETQETFLFLFVFLYILVLKKRADDLLSDRQ